jgi:alpha-galactosidase
VRFLRGLSPAYTTAWSAGKFYLHHFILAALLTTFLAPLAHSADTELKNGELDVRVSSVDGTYSIARVGGPPALRAGVAAEVNHLWIRVADYPKHDVTGSDFDDALGKGHQATFTASGLPERPDLTYTIRIYDNHPFGEIQVRLVNRSGRTCEVQSIRSLEATGKQILDLHADPSADRVLSDSYSEDWPPLQIFDLGKAPNGMHRAVGSQLIYNRRSRESAFFGALTSDRLLTILHLNTKPGAAEPTITSFTVDSTGTTEIQATDEESGLRQGPAENKIELSLPLEDGASLSSERLMFSLGSDYHAQLESYGAAIRELHHSRIAEDNMLGWWSWTAFYMKITEGNTFTNALWLAEHLKELGYNYFHFDFGYAYARGEYSMPNASKFPHGMRLLTQRIEGLGLTIGIWTAPFEVGERSFIYQQHKDWLVHNAKGDPIQVTTDEEIPNERVFVLDPTQPQAQEWLRQTYQVLVQKWGVKYIKLDFMDNTAIEGYYYRPHTTALEAQRIGLRIIRDAVGNEVLLDKDGSPMLNPVGIVDDGRVSQDTGHSFERSKEAAPGIAARYYMHRNFFINDPDAFTVSRQLMEEREIQAPLTLNEAEVSIALSAVSGGMYEIGDDLPTLGADADRMALVKNADLLAMAKLGRSSLPIDLLSYRPEDGQPSIFLSREDARQSILSVFNWTEKSRSHRFSFSDLNLAPGRTYEFKDVFEPSLHVSAENNSIQIEQPAHSVRMIKIIDASISAAAPSITIHAPQTAKLSEDIPIACDVDTTGVPALAFHWDFGDGTTETGRQVRHAYTMAGTFTVKLVVEGVDGIAAQKSVSIPVQGNVVLQPPTRYEPIK